MPIDKVADSIVSPDPRDPALGRRTVGSQPGAPRGMFFSKNC
jgi:hypothetical protein